MLHFVATPSVVLSLFLTLAPTHALNIPHHDQYHQYLQHSPKDFRTYKRQAVGDIADTIDTSSSTSSSTAGTITNAPPGPVYGVSGDLKAPTLSATAPGILAGFPGEIPEPLASAPGLLVRFPGDFSAASPTPSSFGTPSLTSHTFLPSQEIATITVLPVTATVTVTADPVTVYVSVPYTKEDEAWRSAKGPLESSKAAVAVDYSAKTTLTTLTLAPNIAIASAQASISLVGVDLDAQAHYEYVTKYTTVTTQRRPQ